LDSSRPFATEVFFGGDFSPAPLIDAKEEELFLFVAMIGATVKRKIVFCQALKRYSEKLLMPTLPKSPKSAKKRSNIYNRPDWYVPYNDAPWRRFRAKFLLNHPLCAGCFSRNKIVGSNVVDHVFPWRGDKARFWNNLFQALCEDCHRQKTRSEASDHFIWWNNGVMRVLKPSDFETLVKST
jgi:hypothetical protein